MSKVFVLDTEKQPLEPVHPGYARWLLTTQKAAVFRQYPFTIIPLLISAKGHGTRQACCTDKYGFPSQYVPRFKFVKGFQTGDIVKAIVTSGKKVGTYVGRVATRSTGSFNIRTGTGLVQGISHKYCQPIHKKDGYGYSFSGGNATPVEGFINSGGRSSCASDAALCFLPCL